MSIFFNDSGFWGFGGGNKCLLALSFTRCLVFRCGCQIEHRNLGAATVYLSFGWQAQLEERHGMRSVGRPNHHAAG